MWKSAYVGVYQLLNGRMHGETFKWKNKTVFWNADLYAYQVLIPSWRLETEVLEQARLTVTWILFKGLVRTAQ